MVALGALFPAEDTIPVQPIIVGSHLRRATDWFGRGQRSCRSRSARLGLVQDLDVTYTGSVGPRLEAHELTTLERLTFLDRPNLSCFEGVTARAQDSRPFAVVSRRIQEGDISRRPSVLLRHDQASVTRLLPERKQKSLQDRSGQVEGEKLGRLAAAEDELGFALYRRPVSFIETRSIH
jgi:hypothetical protein